jgi:N6-adenosine-specific RNA methylase IME4
VDQAVEIIEPDVAQAADYVSTAWRKSIEAILETGRRLIEIREQFIDEPGKWSRLIGGNQWKGQGLLPFVARHTYRLISIAEDARLVTHVSLLPTDTYTLYQLTRLPAQVFDDKLAEGAIGPELQRADVQLWINRLNRAERFKAFASPALPDDPVPVLYVDPPWQFKVWEESSAYGAALEHYPTMSLDDLCALPIGDCSTDDAILFMWTTAPMLREAFAVLDAWGFTYKTGMVWDKERQGMGYYVRNQHEELLIATRGDMSTPDPANKPISVIRSPRGKHSAKPHVVYDHIERMYPDLRKREFFGRYWRPGWEKPWGNQEIAAVGEAAA